MKILKHFIVVFVLASAMTYYLYSYKPRDYTTLELINGFILNTGVWLFIFSAPYMILVYLVRQARRYFR